MASISGSGSCRAPAARVWSASIRVPTVRTHLVVKVGAPPEDGRANLAMLRVLASALGVGISSLRLTGGAGSRLKRVLVAADPAAVAARLAELLGRPG